MNNIVVCIGQAGNQIGCNLWHLLASETAETNNSFFQDEFGYCRGVFIDTEPKVVEKLFTDHSLIGHVAHANAAWGQSGRGNNWAYGYNPPVIGDSQEPEDDICQKGFEILRKEIEKTDMFFGINMIHSLGGGTGSGLGSKFMEMYRNEYPSAYLVTTSIFPKSTGESPLQYYNTTLGFAHIQEFADTCIIFENDSLFDRMTVEACSKNTKSYSLNNVNNYIALCLQQTMLLHPNHHNDLSEFIALTPSPSFKLLQIHTAPYLYDNQPINDSNHYWLDMITKVTNQVQKKDPKDIGLYGRQHKSLFIRGILKGQDAEKEITKTQTIYNKLIKKLEEPYPVVAWNEGGLKMEAIKTHPLKSHPNIKRNISIIANRSTVLHPLVLALQKAKIKFKAKAYLKWYKMFGCEEDTFENTFDVIENVIDNYTSVLD